jgi:hypothetical protein
VVTSIYLKYLFRVIYKDGTEFQQTQEDVSKNVPGGSAFSDVNQDKVKKFILEGASGLDNSIGVDLNEGYFWNGNIFYVGEPGPKPYKLIFYRQHTHNFNIDREELSHIIKYCIGYVDAKGVDHKIYVD